MRVQEADKRRKRRRRRRRRRRRDVGTEGCRVRRGKRTARGGEERSRGSSKSHLCKRGKL